MSFSCGLSCVLVKFGEDELGEEALEAGLKPFELGT